MESVRRAFVKTDVATTVDSREATGNEWMFLAGRALLTGLLIVITAIFINRLG
jgi:hypothetical protein